MSFLSSSEQGVARENIVKFSAWVAERDAAGDLRDYTRGEAKPN